MRRVLALPTWQLLVALLGVSAALRVWAADTIPTPWIVPDELIYAELGRAFWRTGHLTLFGHDTQFFSLLSPVLAGLPLSLDDREAGYRLLQALQAVVMSLAAVPTYLWARALVPRGWALVAAVLALVPPSLAYAGLIMTEVAFYPAVVLAAWAVWRALERPEPRTQAWALASIVLVCSVRLQGFVVALAYLTAIAFDRRRWRSHLPVLAGFAVVGVLWSAWQLRHGGPVTKVLGAYQAAGEAHYAFGATFRFVVYHLADVVLITGVVPVLALGLLRGRDVRLFRVLTLALTAWLVLQVGVFASRHIGHTAERNLFGLLPLYGIATVTWLVRGAPRPRRAVAALGALCVVLLVVFPCERFASLASTPSNFTLVPLHQFASHANLDLVVPLAGAVLVAAVVLLPLRIARVAVPACLVALGVAASVATSRFIVREARVTQAIALGPQREWIDPIADAPVAWLFTEDVSWVSVWESAFWNGRVRDFYDLLGAVVPGGLPQRSVGPFEDGSLVLADGTPVLAPYVLASRTVHVDGFVLGGAQPGYQLWRVNPPLRLTSWLRGVNTSSYAPSGLVVFSKYACRPGTLDGTLVSDQERFVTIRRNGQLYERITVRANVAVTLAVPARVPEPVGSGRCTFTLQANGPFYATGLAYT